ncbi:hypothetical protein Kpol_1031p69 [Vanderwaltozyma polyspora DSM 70294]|uniref:ATP-dependent RNA helicase SUV3, mitochondrial n=1 Tax=Vanderwaltozyma polyspora (strain ATCC 22028 / DSM 70294 / BCRC 21397 / CBS 2163 / NBRC 10782 / NRRL Y-8283 / UCD 57-17) TaxID=436907 RepID=A7TI00_VANPO|nr:uncharacterized protein Kpol_1031p69 [Vanderwaltozyma polyspora DSM 70294]EDO18162.1 hypothetical protein Kpol_1031p69 [Vanderwaltozyma polyspora DSM 70294]
MIRILLRSGYSRRSYSNVVPPKIFKNSNWLIKKPVFKYLPKEELDKDKIRFDLNLKKLDPNSIYSKDSQFKSLLDNVLQYIFNKKCISFAVNEASMKFYTWLKLRNYIYEQLNDKELDSKIKKYEVGIMETIRPTKPSDLLCQLIKVNEINDVKWKIILQDSVSNDKITNFDKYLYLISKTFDHINFNEITPNLLPSLDTSNKIDIQKKFEIPNPIEWFPEARKMKRTIIMHLGPTNSGKTYRALQRLKQAQRGYYAGPLRLLAREIYDRFRLEGHRCNLLTGEEVITDLNSIGTPAGLTSGTVEMVPLNRQFDVLVLDEIQMLADPERGWAWTNAVLGARAHEIHLCGEKSVLPLIKKIVDITGDNLIVNEYDRLGKLEIESDVLSRGLRSLRRGDCVVAFSKKTILDLKLKIEKQTKHKVAVIYGSLPPETRLQQANLFNSGEYDVLVASDAIGMGLNLSIDRIIFTTDTKFNGREMISLSSSNVKQIAGRAGRFKQENNGKNGNSTVGYVTSFDKEVLKSVKRGLEQPIEYIESAVIWPTDEINTQILNKLPPKTELSELLIEISKELKKSSNNMFMLTDLRNRLNLIEVFKEVDGIPLNDKLKLSNAPMKDLPLVRLAFKQFCETIANRKTKTILSYNLPFELLDFDCIYDDKYGLDMYESLYNIITLFLWLSNRYPNFFVDLESAKDLKIFCELIIYEKLDRLKKNPYQRGFQNSINIGKTFRMRETLVKKNRGWQDRKLNRQKRIM